GLLLSLNLHSVPIVGDAALRLIALLDTALHAIGSRDIRHAAMRHSSRQPQAHPNILSAQISERLDREGARVSCHSADLVPRGIDRLQRLLKCDCLGWRWPQPAMDDVMHGA